jgi:dTDP-4-dehydrorhamnose reductase
VTTRAPLLFLRAMRLLVIGSAGMLGTDLLAVAEAAGHETAGLDLPEIDITDADGTRAIVASHEPDAVINCAAYTAVDAAETDEERATLINGTGAGNVAAAAAAAGAHVVQISTDYVFTGEASTPWPEDAETGPRTAYGRSKLAGEIAVAEAAPDSHAIARTAWLFGPHGKNFVDTMLRLGRERGEVTVVDDQVGCPTYAGHLAAALVEIAEQRLTGIHHTAGSGSCTWWDLAVAAYERTGAEVTVNRGGTAELGYPAPRPLYSVLGVTRKDTPRLPRWQDGLEAHLAATKERV